MLHKLPIEHLDKALARWRSLDHSRPRGGWLRAIREALGMTTRQMAHRVGVTAGAVSIAEGSEARNEIALATLQRYATALDCELVYALVPRRSLEEVLEEQADRIARDQVSRVRHSMALEDQSTSRKVAEREVAEVRQRLLDGKLSRLWQ